MALLGTEGIVKCPKCGSIHFVERTIVIFDYQKPELVKQCIENKQKAPVYSTQYIYYCASCNTRLKEVE